MPEATRQAADRFLQETYGFDAATRTAIITRGMADIARNFEELRRALADGPGEASRRLAHRLKGNLRALGLTGLAAKAQGVEGRDVDRACLEATMRELARALAPQAAGGPNGQPSSGGVP